MTSVTQGKKKIAEAAHRLPKVRIPLGKALGCVLAEDVHVPISLPAANHSAMDGFVLRSQDVLGAHKDRPVHLRICGVIKAGDSRRTLKKGETFRMMTGAVLPTGTDTVIAKEDACARNGSLIVCERVGKGSHVRFAGEELRRGERLLEARTLISPAVMGILAVAGLDKVTVFRKPRVTLLATGSELVKPGRALKSGQVYESNSWMVSAALRWMGIKPREVSHVPDRLEKLKRETRRALAGSDVVIVTGGVSVGEYDFVKEALKLSGVRKVFWGVAQKPGKPLYFGRKSGKLVFGLPGNTASAFTCFYEYVYPALRRMMGFRTPDLRRSSAILAKMVPRHEKRYLFLKGRMTVDGAGRKKAIPLSRQASHMISSLAQANGFLLVPPGESPLKKGALVMVDFIPTQEEGPA